MSDEQSQESTDTNEEQAPDERAMLMQRARMMGLNISNNIGLETLKERINAKMQGEPDPLPKTDELEASAQKAAPPSLQDPENPAPAKVETLRQKLVRENMRLIRLRITNMDPKKKDLPGEIMTVANGYLGTVRKYVPFGEQTENGYHVPYCLYKYLKSRKFLNIRTYKDRRNNNEIKVEQNWAPEFALEVLPPLTQGEIRNLATAQAAKGGLD